MDVHAKDLSGWTDSNRSYIPLSDWILLHLQQRQEKNAGLSPKKGQQDTARTGNEHPFWRP
jgi:hypothetical protein